MQNEKTVIYRLRFINPYLFNYYCNSLYFFSGKSLFSFYSATNETQHSLHEVILEKTTAKSISTYHKIFIKLNQKVSLLVNRQIAARFLPFPLKEPKGIKVKVVHLCC